MTDMSVEEKQIKQYGVCFRFRREFEHKRLFGHGTFCCIASVKGLKIIHFILRNSLQSIWVKLKIDFGFIINLVLQFYFY
jgi:hypothetical protein